MPGGYTITVIARRVLHAFSNLHRILSEDGFASIAHLINLQWDTSREVELSLNNGTVVCGRFLRIDLEGRLLVETSGRISTHVASDVALLRECDSLNFRQTK